MKKKINKEKIIDQIENVRKKNNTNWMNILRIAFKYAPKETSRIFSQINKNIIKTMVNNIFVLILIFFYNNIF